MVYSSGSHTVGHGLLGGVIQQNEGNEGVGGPWTKIIYKKRETTKKVWELLIYSIMVPVYSGINPNMPNWYQKCVVLGVNCVKMANVSINYNGDNKNCSGILTIHTFQLLPFRRHHNRSLVSISSASLHQLFACFPSPCPYTFSLTFLFSWLMVPSSASYSNCILHPGNSHQTPPKPNSSHQYCIS